MSTAASAGTSARFAAVAAATSRPALRSEHVGRPAETFGELTFADQAQQDHLPREVYLALRDVIRRRARLDADLARAVAHGMKAWARSCGATHFCHWFQPQTGLTAEKHDSFLAMGEDGRPLERFSGAQLCQGEPDASSFPSGGARSTFEARGYTTWDPTSPAFVVESSAGRTLCVPSHFVSYDGQALDEKTPLIRSMDLLGRRCSEVLELLGLPGTGVHPTAGIEQEYFLVDRALATLRPDLLLTGRTLLGARPAKGQELEDHYFGAIRERVQAFMDDLDRELVRLGVPVKTRHNEVAPMQFELAPLFEEAHLAADHNQLVMARAKAVAERHAFTLLLHEKPFAGVNGSGKHINWSLRSDEGDNLLEPGESPAQNIRFLVFLCAVLEAVQAQGALLRAAVASAGNDHRLGANEAPPAIMSVFVGTRLGQVLDVLAGKKRPAVRDGGDLLRLGLPHLHDLPRDTTDRNRTAPIAFTGNKFEFRAAGSSQSVGLPIAVLNAAVAEGLERLVGELRTEAGRKPLGPDAVLIVLGRSARRTRPVRFEGNCYDEAWRQEALSRGLPELLDTPAALEAFQAEGAAFLTRTGVFLPAEVEGRRRVRLERYCRVVEIEAACLADLARTQVLPTLLTHRANCLQGAGGGRRLGRYRKSLDGTVDALLGALDDLETARHAAETGPSEEERARLLAHRVLPAMASLRSACDAAEATVDDALWPSPKYRELLFLA